MLSWMYVWVYPPGPCASSNSPKEKWHPPVEPSVVKAPQLWRQGPLSHLSWSADWSQAGLPPFWKPCRSWPYSLPPIHSVMLTNPLVGPEQESSAAVTSCHVWETVFLGQSSPSPGLNIPFTSSSKTVLETWGGAFVRMSHTKTVFSVLWPDIDVCIEWCPLGEGGEGASRLRPALTYVCNHKYGEECLTCSLRKTTVVGPPPYLAIGPETFWASGFWSGSQCQTWIPVCESGLKFNHKEVG